VRAQPRRARTAVLAFLLAFGASRVAAQEASEPDPRPVDATPTPPWAYSPEPRPIRESVDRAVAEFIEEHSPCGPAGGDGVPCFPVLVEAAAPEYSVRDSLRRLEPDNRRMPGPPTPAELHQFGANPLPVSGTVSFDPICKTKQLVRKIFGRGRTYYVYRVWDQTGERAVLREQPLDPAAFAGTPEFQYESLGRFGNECEAIKAYRKATHDARMAREASGGEASVELGSDNPE
jgi:hypothetical protein